MQSYILPDDQEETETLPEEIEAVVEQMRARRNELIQNLTIALVSSRKEAIDGRQQTGIEEIWQEDREYYLGIDDLNRDTARFLKPSTGSGVLQKNQNVPGKGERCTAFFNITRQFCDAASARMADILIPSGDWNFAVRPSPISEDINSAQQQQDDQLTPQPVLVQDGRQEEELKKSARAKAEKAEARIRDWLTECRYHGESRKVLENAAQTGTGILKGPVPVLQKSMQIVRGQEGVRLAVVEKVVPASVSVEPENFYPDPACGDDIQKGKYTWEVDEVSAKELKKLADSPGYIKAAIEKVYSEGPAYANLTNRSAQTGVRRGFTSDRDIFEIWYYNGLIDAEALTAFNVQVDAKSLDTLVPCVATVINDTIVKITVSHLDTGSFPYDVMVWQRIKGFWAGLGIARQGRTAQEMLNASCRALMDNAGMSAGPIIIMKDKAVRPADGNMVLTARKIFLVDAAADAKNIDEVFKTVDIPMMEQQIRAVIDLAYKMMEDSTGIFFIMQGQQGDAPNSVGGLFLMHKNSSAILRRLAGIYDERLTEPHIKRYYEYLMIYGEDSEKGDLQIEAIGSSSLVEREIQSMEAATLLQASLNKEFGINPEKAMAEVLKAKRYVLEKWQYTDEEKRAMAEQPPPPLPQVEVAKIRAEVEMLKAEMKKQTDELKIRVDMDRDKLYADGVARRDYITVEQSLEELKLKERLAILDYANKNEMNLNQVKAQLAETAMKLNVQKELSLQKAGEAIKPVAEPPGKAPDGESFVK